MVSLQIRIYPDPILKEKAQEVSSFNAELKRLLKEMGEKMYEARGVGLAAPQVGISKRVVVVDVSDDRSELRYLVNPEIIEKHGKQSGEEGCLSIPGYRDIVERASNIRVKAQDADGRQFEFDADGLLSICIQHEIDHLDGILFVDRLSRLKKEMFKKWFKKQTEL